MADFKGLSNLQMFFDLMRTDKRKITIHPIHAMSIKGIVIHAGEDFAAIQIRGRQHIIPYNAIQGVDVEE